MTGLSVVIPMYNEAGGIVSCLRSLLAQTRPVDEIIVVDNNSTDGSGEAARNFAKDNPTVRVITEVVPGCYAARARGYDAASHEIIARTDADCRVAPDWAERIVGFFDSEEGKDFVALTGMTMLYDGPPFKFVKKRTLTPPRPYRQGGGECGSVHGLNHAILSSAWHTIRKDLLQRQDTWEDLDIGFCLYRRNLKIYFDPLLFVSTSIRGLKRSPRESWHYASGGIRTVKGRGSKKVERAMYVDFPVRMAAFTAMWILFRPWDEEEKNWRVRRLFQSQSDPHLDVTASR